MTNKFNDVKDDLLRTYNRVVVAFNIKNDLGADAVLEYVADFSQKEILEMKALADLIEREGVEPIKREILKRLDGQYYDQIASGEIVVESV